MKKLILTNVLMLILASTIFSQVVPDGYYVDGYDYPLHNKGYDVFGNEIIVLEFIDPEINNIYPGYATYSPDRECSGPYCGAPDTVSNHGDVGEFNGIAIHDGEDLNIGSGTDDAGEEISVVANGQVVAILLVNNAGGPLAFGWMMVVRHCEPDGTFHHSTYKHITTLDSISGGICMTESAFTVQVGDWVLRGQPIARIATGFTNPSNATHLHFEMRDTTFYYTTPASLYERDNGRHSYGGFVDCVTPCSNSGLHFAGYMDSSQVRIAYNNMQRDGIIDPSDFIENHRPSTYSPFAVAPEIEWQNTIGGSNSESIALVSQVEDGGYIVGGTSSSNISGDKTSNTFGGDDYWITKINSSGNVIWDKTIGGNSGDSFRFLVQASDGGYILGGFSHSEVSGSKTQANIGADDYWIIKTDLNGNIIWDKVYGGNDQDYLLSIDKTSDGGYILGGYSSSNASGNKTEDVIGGLDYWIVKINSSGIIEWQKTIGGNSDDILIDIKEVSDGGYILCGISASGISGNKTEENIGQGDYWIVKVNSTGDVIWDKTIGGTFSDNAYSIKQTFDGGYIIGGFSNSGISGDKTEPCLGNDDFWVVKINNIGNIEWQNTIGGSYYDRAFCANQTTDGGYIIIGSSNSALEDDKTEASDGYEDYWVIKLNNIGEIQWQSTLGGSTEDIPYSVEQTSDGGYILGGVSHSNISADKDENGLGEYDYWVIKLAGTCTPNTETCNSLDDDCDGLVDDSISISITIDALGPITFCQGSSIVLTATHTGTSVQWYKNGTAILGATSLFYTASTSGSYTCITTAPCATATSSPITITVNKNPTATITAGGTTTFCAGGSVILTANAGGGLSYQWYKGAAAIAGATSINYTATLAGNYKCRVTKTATGCFKNSNVITVSVPCKKGTETDNFVLYPNPASGEIYINLDNPKFKSLDIVISNNTGQVVLQKNTNEDGSVVLDISKLPQSLYLLNIQINGYIIYSEKFIVQ